MMSKPFELHQGDCLDILRSMPDNSIDACISDPPYGLSDHKLQDVVDCLTAWLAGKEYKPNKRGFCGRSWDAWVPGPEVWREVLRVLKPGGHLLAFAGTRSMDLMSMAVRLAGFELRDAVGYANDGGDPTQAPLMAWCYGTGFNKVGYIKHDDGSHVMQGFGGSLKPAWEPIILARKPLSEGTVAANVLAHGTGALNIDGCRVDGGDDPAARYNGKPARGENTNAYGAASKRDEVYQSSPLGRWPANMILQDSDEIRAMFPDSAGSGGSVPNVKVTGYGGGIGTGESKYLGGERKKVEAGSGSAARFFYCAKASRKDRNEGLTSSDKPAVANGATMREQEDADWSKRNGNYHHTVKPTDLMAYLCRLVIPPGGVVLDPFMGSGSTGKAAMRECFNFIGCELSPEYLEIARARIEYELAKRTPPQVASDAPVQQDLFSAA